MTPWWKASTMTTYTLTQNCSENKSLKIVCVILELEVIILCQRPRKIKDTKSDSKWHMGALAKMTQKLSMVEKSLLRHFRVTFNLQVTFGRSRDGHSGSLLGVFDFVGALGSVLPGHKNYHPCKILSETLIVFANVFIPHLTENTKPRYCVCSFLWSSLQCTFCLAITISELTGFIF